jgi:hypothetical protein
MPKINYDITIQDRVTGDYYLVPVLPIDGKIVPEYGETKADAVDIVNLGTVEFPTGADLDTISWYSFFPARHDPGYVRAIPTRLSKPMSYSGRFKYWLKKKTPLQIIIPAVGVNTRMYLSKYTPEHGEGAEGDVYYTAEFRQYHHLTPRKISTSTKNISKKPTPAARPAAPSKTTKAKTYTVKKNETLTGIAKALKIKDWRKNLYEPNKKVIGNNPNNIKAGMVLKLP